MAPQDQNRGPVPLWNFFQSLDPNRAPGHGVDHNAPPFLQFPAGFPFTGPGHRAPPWPPGPAATPGAWDAEYEWGPWSHDGGHGCGRGRRGPWGSYTGGCGHGHRHRGDASEDQVDGSAARANEAGREAGNEKGASPDTMDQDVPDPAEVTPEEDDNPPPYGPGRRSHGRCRRGGMRRGGRYNGNGAPFDLPGMMHGITGHPFFQSLRDQAQRYAGQAGQPDDGDDSSFTPPVDVFNTKVAFVVHVALPGANKEDIGVNWNPDTGSLRVAGVVHRPGDELFLETLASGERRVGVFERDIALPPAGADEKDDVDGPNITAKMDNGILVVVVPKAEKEWTEIRRVDIE